MNEMRPVYLLGAAVTPVAEHWERSLGDLAHEACAAAQSFRTPLSESALAEIRARAIEARQGKGPCWWNPDPEA